MSASSWIRNLYSFNENEEEVFEYITKNKLLTTLLQAYDEIIDYCGHPEYIYLELIDDHLFIIVHSDEPRETIISQLEELYTNWYAELPHEERKHFNLVGKPNELK